MFNKRKDKKKNVDSQVSEMDNKIDLAMAKIIEETVGDDILPEVNSNKEKKNTKKQKEKQVQGQGRKKGKALKITCIILGVLILIAGAVYGGVAYYYHDKFFKGTQINNINCEQLTAAQTEDLIRKQVEDYKITVQFRDSKSQDILGSEIGYEYVPSGEVEKILGEQKLWQWITGYFSPKKYEVSKDITFSKDQLKSKLESLDCMIAENQTAPQDAYVVFQETEFVIVGEVQGTTINEEILLTAIDEAVASSQESVSAEEAGSYTAPTILSDNAELVAERDLLNTYAKASITYTFGEKTEVVDGSIIKDWLSYDEQGKFHEDPKALKENVQAYVKDLASRYDTSGKDRVIKSSASGKDVTVKGGDYGWKINQKKEVEQLFEEITTGQAVTREPIYSKTAVTRSGNEIGNTYVEVDLGSQHLWFYKDGKLIVDSDLVSGNMAYKDRVTPSGSYSLAYKQRDKVLRGKLQPDGTYEYESPVSYWMPFNGGIGLHDATWRHGVFGGDIYKTRGSHGCVNLPVSVAETIFNNIEKAVPIICFY